MDFFQQQSQARARSRRLLLLFLLAVLGIVGAIDLVVLLALGWFRRDAHGMSLQPLPILCWTTFGVIGVIGCASLYRIAALGAGGGSAVARELGATLVPPDTANPGHRRLRNVVEEIAIASGLPVPQLFVLEQESGINAFAAGYSPADAAVTVTRGALDKLSRDELQGVVAHEFSHVLNGDMRLNIRLMGLLFGILLLGIIGGKTLQFGPNSDSRRGGAAIFVVALGLLVIGYIGVFFGRLIKAGVSRQREYLADASAVQFTRQNAGIAGALKKVAGIDAGSKLQNTHGEEVAHMLFGDGIGYSDLFATHPPLLRRIQALEPGFGTHQLEQLSARWNTPGYLPEDEERPLLADFAAARKDGLAVAPAAVAASVARPKPGHYDCAAALHRALPPPLLDAARDPEQALDLVFALLLDGDAALREQQLGQVEQGFGAPHRAAAAALWPGLAALDPAQRLPLAAIAMPSLRRQPRQRLIQLVKTVAALVLADGKVGVFEYCLGRVLRSQVLEALRPAQAAAHGRRKLADCAEHIQCLLSVLADFGQDDAASAQRAFLAGLQRLPLRESPVYRPPSEWVAAMDLALNALDELEPAAKGMLLEALGATMAADGVITVEEAELLRAVCAALHCPLPPVLQDAALTMASA